MLPSSLLMTTIWPCFYFLCFPGACNQSQNERTFLPKSCPEKYHQGVPEWAVRRHAPCQQLDTRCKGQPWLVKLLVLPADGYCRGTGPDMDASLTVPSVCAAHSTLSVRSTFVDAPAELNVIVTWSRRGRPGPNSLCEQCTLIDKGRG